MEQMPRWLPRPLVMISSQTDSGVKTTHRALNQVISLHFPSNPCNSFLSFSPREEKQIEWQDFWLFDTCGFSFLLVFGQLLCLMVNRANGSSGRIRAMSLEMLTATHSRSPQSNEMSFYILKEFVVWMQRDYLKRLLELLKFKSPSKDFWRVNVPGKLGQTTILPKQDDFGMSWGPRTCDVCWGGVCKLPWADLGAVSNPSHSKGLSKPRGLL